MRDALAVPGVFISYRRDDCPSEAFLLFERLRRVFAEEFIFLDTKAIRPADEFKSVILRRLACSDVLLVVIGPRWLNIAGTTGSRLDEPNDFVRLEVETGVQSNITVVTALVRNAHMPKADELPTTIARLAGLQAVTLSMDHFDLDVEPIVRTIRKQFRIPHSRVRQWLLAYRPRPDDGWLGWLLRLSFFLVGFWSLSWAIGIPAAARLYGPEGLLLQIGVAAGGLVAAAALSVIGRTRDTRCRNIIATDAATWLDAAQGPMKREDRG